MVASPCGVGEILHTLGKKHALFVLEEILLGKYSGFNKFSKKIGVTSKVLAQRLSEMETIGLIAKNGESYEITDKGRRVGSILLQLKTDHAERNSVYSFCTKTACSDCRGKGLSWTSLPNNAPSMEAEKSHSANRD